jgi:hypothetical protein
MSIGLSMIREKILVDSLLVQVNAWMEGYIKDNLIEDRAMSPTVRLTKSSTSEWTNQVLPLFYRYLMF